MATYASNSYVQFAYGTEATYGVPATELKLIDFTDANLTSKTTMLEDDSRDSTRQAKHGISGNRDISGNLDVNFKLSMYDDFLASAFFNDWTSNTLKVGKVFKSLTVEQGFTDITLFRSASGVLIDKLTAELKVDGLATMSFDMTGKDLTDFIATPIDATPTAAAQKNAIKACEILVKLDGATIGYAQTLKLEMSNGIEQAFALGNCSPAAVAPGTLKVTGDIDMLFETADIANKAKNDTSAVLSFTITDGTATQVWTLPNVRFSDFETKSGKSGFVAASAKFTASYDATAATSISVVRS